MKTAVLGSRFRPKPLIVDTLMVRGSFLGPEFKTPTRTSRFFSAESPHNDSDLQQDIVWDAGSPSPGRPGETRIQQNWGPFVDSSAHVSAALFLFREKGSNAGSCRRGHLRHRQQNRPEGQFQLLQTQSRVGSWLSFRSCFVSCRSTADPGLQNQPYSSGSATAPPSPALLTFKPQNLRRDPPGGSRTNN